MAKTAAGAVYQLKITLKGFEQSALAKARGKTAIRPRRAT